MRILFIGSVEFSRRALDMLLTTDAQIVGVCTLQQSAFNADHCDLSVICEAHRIPWVYAPDINTDKTFQWMADQKPDVIFCFGWSRLLGTRVLNLARLGVVGFHPAALPANRGRHPLIWALALGLRETASTFFFMKGGADNGDILLQQKLEIEENDNATTLYEKMTLCALEQIRIFLPQLVSGDYTRTIQDERYANTWRKRKESDGRIDWRMSAYSIHNLARALSKPYVGAGFLYQGQEYKAWKTEIVSDVPPNVEPGKVFKIVDRGPIVKCGELGICVLETKPLFRPSLGEYL